MINQKIRRLGEIYQQIFSVQELAENKILKWAFGAFLLGLFLTFYNWVGSDEFTKEAFEQARGICWAHYQNCGSWAFLSALPYGYSQTIWFMFMMGVMALVVYLMSLSRWGWAHFLTLCLWFGKSAVTFMSMNHIGNYEYYVVVFGLAILLLPHKLFFLRFYLVLFYFLSVAVKIHETWILGTYFSALKTGIPIFPDWSIPVWTNGVMFMEAVAAWFLFHKNIYIQRTVFIFFVTFHLYSGILVEYRYPATVLPILLIVFGPWFKYSAPPKGWKTLPGWIVAAILCLGQAWSHIIPGDEKYTLEGNYYGLYMFEANHQCVSRATVYLNNGEVVEKVRRRNLARHRCNPYNYWYQYDQWCELDPDIKSVAWTFDHSINGGPFYRLVNERNACDLTYSPWKRNEWIKLPAESRVMGYPIKNFYH